MGAENYQNATGGGEGGITTLLMLGNLFDAVPAVLAKEVLLTNLDASSERMGLIRFRILHITNAVTT